MQARSISLHTMPQANTSGVTSEEALIAAAKQKPENFRFLYEKYYEQILRFVYQRLTSKDDAYDVTQQVFIQAMVSLPKYEMRGLPFSSWLYRIAINELNQLFRKEKKTRGINCSEAYLKDIAQEIEQPLHIAHEQAVVQAMAHLEEEDFQLVEMRFFEKRPFKEISEILGMSEAATKMKLYRILDKLKPIISKQIDRQN
jgi:RNA polymerase sigma-70 factor (ECF subfamily)